MALTTYPPNSAEVKESVELYLYYPTGYSWRLLVLIYLLRFIFGSEAKLKTFNRAWPWPPTPTSAEVKERVELYLYYPTGHSWRLLVSIYLLRFTFGSEAKLKTFKLK